MKMDRIQLRILLNCGEKCEPLREFELKKKKYKILAKSKKHHLIPTLVPIGVIINGCDGQFLVEDADGNKYDAYIYFYRNFEGRWCAVVDTLEKREEQDMEGETMG